MESAGTDTRLEWGDKDREIEVRLEGGRNDYFSFSQIPDYFSFFQLFILQGKDRYRLNTQVLECSESRGGQVL